MKRRYRDTQRSRVYAWQQRAGIYAKAPPFKTVDECDAYMRPIWRAERGRVGLARVKAPRIEPGRGGGMAHGTSLITLGRWARQPAVILHEMAHCLTPGDLHGPRFVGVYIGLLARHLGRDADELMAFADEMGIRYSIRAVGLVPVSSLPERLARLLPIGYMDAAIELGVSYRAVYGAALNLTRHGRARWRGKTLVAVDVA